MLYGLNLQTSVIWRIYVCQTCGYHRLNIAWKEKSGRFRGSFPQTNLSAKTISLKHRTCEAPTQRSPIVRCNIQSDQTAIASCLLYKKLTPVLLYPGLLPSLIQPISLLVGCHLITSSLSGCLIRAGSLLHKRKLSFHTCTLQQQQQQKKRDSKFIPEKYFFLRSGYLTFTPDRDKQAGRQADRSILLNSKPLFKRQI